MGVRKYRKNLDLSSEWKWFDAPLGGKILGPVMRPRFKHMGRTSNEDLPQLLVDTAAFLALVMQHYPRPAERGRGETLYNQSINLVAEWYEAEEITDAIRGRADQLMHRLEICITNHTPIYTYFGQHPVDSHIYGVWPDKEAADEAAAAGELLMVSHADTVPHGYGGHILLLGLDGIALFHVRSWGSGTLDHNLSMIWQYKPGDES